MTLVQLIYFCIVRFPYYCLVQFVHTLKIRVTSGTEQKGKYWVERLYDRTSEYIPIQFWNFKMSHKVFCEIAAGHARVRILMLPQKHFDPLWRMTTLWCFLFHLIFYFLTQIKNLGHLLCSYILSKHPFATNWRTRSISIFLVHML